MEEDILNVENSLVQQLYFVLLQSNRSEENTVEENVIVEDARELHQTQSTWNTDKSTFLRLLCTRRLVIILRNSTTFLVQFFKQFSIEIHSSHLSTM